MASIRISEKYRIDVIQRVASVSQDVTKTRQWRQETVKIQRAGSKCNLAGGIAHDLNNLLTVVFGNISLARLQLSDVGTAAKLLEDAENARVHITDLTQQLLDFARGSISAKKIFKIDDLLFQAAHFAVHGSNVNCKFELVDDLWHVEADEGQLFQVVHNLILNAVQATLEGGTVTISSENSSHPNGDLFVKITVVDTGIGIPENRLQTIFDPYFTTKKQGIGLGLTTSYAIIKRHGGKIMVVSTVGEGSTFVISLPAIAVP